MNRRSFLKFLGIGSATAVVAPSVALAAVPEPIAAEPVVSWTTDTFKWEPLGQKIYRGKYLYVHVPRTSRPFRTGDAVNYKTVWRKYRGRRERHVIAYKAKYVNFLDQFAMAICDVVPGNYAMVQISSSSRAVPSPVYSDYEIQFSAKTFEPETGCSPIDWKAEELQA